MVKYITMQSIYILLLPALTLAKIHIELSDKYDIIDISYSGSFVDTISETEATTFKLNDENLKNAIENYFRKRPDQVYLRSPTPWGDLYNTYNWQQVTRTIVPKDVQMTATFHKVPITQKLFKNESNRRKTISVGLSHPITNSMSVKWTYANATDEITSDGIVDYHFDLAFPAGTFDLNMTAVWGKTDDGVQNTTINMAYSDTEFGPGEGVYVEVYAINAYIKVTTEYEASLSGTVAANYGKPYLGHHFFGFNVSTLMEDAGLKNSVMVKQYSEISFFILPTRRKTEVGKPSPSNPWFRN